MQEELKKSTQKTLTSEEQAHKIDQLLMEEEDCVAQMEKELTGLREKQVKIFPWHSYTLLYIHKSSCAKPVLCAKWLL